ncbi:hypothetical protein BCR41DRAFT_372658 [Lobosporangium transversale]|uniref:Uncharacterized protein n=1 Tax=Lobosporangium transversale TaxID=64571 RepID=A0A1Y2GHU8_9FUNG|nr:hypothetical protein BCR41DRAFT_372658 [Lobosporangium transversale]ORZ10064.1 hypothetical protein BCR41DRAFT_372658 [Lobosporangium transversale]|eukprot:XP_021879154.1 hypothetical protein BCR41DRAFT_372658 [Lobosporangium transversale]
MFRSTVSDFQGPNFNTLAKAATALHNKLQSPRSLEEILNNDAKNLRGFRTRTDLCEDEDKTNKLDRAKKKILVMSIGAFYATLWINSLGPPIGISFFSKVLLQSFSLKISKSHYYSYSGTPANSNGQHCLCPTNEENGSNHSATELLDFCFVCITTISRVQGTFALTLSNNEVS